MATQSNLDPELENAALRHPSPFLVFLGDCWRHLAAMHDAFAHSQTRYGVESKRRSRERLRDDRAWTRSQ